jgi:hypothetical protein
MADAGRAGGTKRAGRTDADENRGRSVDDETHAVQRVAEGDEEELTPDALAEVGVVQETSYAGTSTAQPPQRGPTTGRKKTNPEKSDARSGSTGSSKGADGSERRSKR